MPLLLLMIALSLAMSNQTQADEITVVFKVTTEGLSDTSQVYITGNHPLIGNWNPAKIALHREAQDSWFIRLTLEKGAQLEYKFTLGDWEKEALAEDGSVPPNSTLLIEKDTTVVQHINRWRDDEARVISGQISGSVRYHRQLQGFGLKPRDVIVWLPPDYEQNSQRRYPVLYMHDGQNIFDPATSFGGVDWQIDETADSLIRKGTIEPIIVVGIYNTSDRFLEYACGDSGARYMKLVTETIKPLIDQTYRTLPEREHTAIGGSSMGGLISFMLLWEYPQVFSKAICMSPAFKIDSLDYVRTIEDQERPSQDVVIYIDNGGVGLEARLQPGIDDMLSTLKKKGYEQSRDFYLRLFPEAEHNEAAWALRVGQVLELFFGKDQK